MEVPRHICHLLVGRLQQANVKVQQLDKKVKRDGRKIANHYSSQVSDILHVDGFILSVRHRSNIEADLSIVKNNGEHLYRYVCAYSKLRI